MNEIASDVLLTHGFEPIISVSLMNERTLVSVVAITYDREVAGEDDRALACHGELASRLLAAGYPPYRLGLASMALARGEGAYADVTASLKQALDPSAILAPGRYAPAAPPRQTADRQPSAAQRGENAPSEVRG